MMLSSTYNYTNLRQNGTVFTAASLQGSATVTRERSLVPVRLRLAETETRSRCRSTETKATPWDPKQGGGAAQSLLADCKWSKPWTNAGTGSFCLSRTPLSDLFRDATVSNGLSMGFSWISFASLPPG